LAGKLAALNFPKGQIMKLFGLVTAANALLGINHGRIGILKAIYPATWGILQVARGLLRKGPIAAEPTGGTTYDGSPKFWKVETDRQRVLKNDLCKYPNNSSTV
jgi:hypothetical protein